MDMGNETSPFYDPLMNQSATAPNYDTWELVYPINFFITLVRTSLDGLRKYQLQNDLDPYSFYEFGTLWKHK
jgi:hypothetical protein